MTVPIAGEVLFTIRGYPDLVEAFRTVKERLGLSNAWVDEQCEWCEGITDKKLGPTQAKPIDPLAFSMFCDLFAIKFEMTMDMDAVKRAEARWQGRAERNVRKIEARISKTIIERAKPHLFSQMGKLGGLARAASLTDKRRSQIARKAAKSRWKGHKAKRRKSRCVAGKSNSAKLTECQISAVQHQTLSPPSAGR